MDSFELMKSIAPLNRSIVSDGIDEALRRIGATIPLKLHEYPSGKECWTWIIPQKWNCREAVLRDGDKILIDFKNHPLHVVSGSQPFEGEVSREELLRHLYYDQKRPEAIPFVYKYYQKEWGLCAPYNLVKTLNGDSYQVRIDATLEPGFLNVGEYHIPGEKKDCIVFVGNICHPGQVNDSLCGSIAQVEIAQRLSKRKNRYSYSFLFLPETIGSLAWLNGNEDRVPEIRAMILTEVLGVDNSLLLQKSRQGDTPLDKIAENVLLKHDPNLRVGGFRQYMGNDEMVWNGPGFDIPGITITRWPFDDMYHSSRDCMENFRVDKWREAVEILWQFTRELDAVEDLRSAGADPQPGKNLAAPSQNPKDYFPRRKFKGPVFLSRYGLWIDWSKGPDHLAKNKKCEKVMLLLEGNLCLSEIAAMVDLTFDELYDYLEIMHRNGLIEKRSHWD